MKSKIICLIPARGGSKRIPKKNIKSFCGTPMIERVILTAKETNLFSEIVVSTDDVEIAELAKRAGATVPFLRPKELADDYSTTISVIKHFVNTYKKINFEEDSICCLYATSIFLRASDLIEAIRIYKETKMVRMIFAALKFSHPIQRGFYIDSKNISRLVNPEYKLTRTQDCQAIFHDAGQFYIAKADDWLNKEISIDGSLPIIMPKWSCHDIDDKSDWDYAEILYRVLKQNNFYEN